MTTFNVNIRERVVIPLTVRPKVTFTLVVNGSTIGLSGSPGLSSYQIWINEGNVGTEQDFLDSLKGEPGLAGRDGAAGEDGTDGNDGETGNGITSVTLTNTVGKVKTYTILFTDLSTTTFTVTDGADGINGADGEDSVVPGPKGDDGYTPIKNVDYFDGTDGDDGLSAYQIWLSNGNVGTEQDYLDSLKGEPGDSGSSFTSGFMHTGIVTGRNINIVAVGYTPTLKEIIRVIPDSEIVDGSAITLSINGGTPVVIHEYTSHDTTYSLVLVFLEEIWGVLALEGEQHTIKGINTGDNVTSGIAAPITTPNKIGDMYVDTTNKKLYFAAGVSSSSDWVIVN